MVVTPTKIPVTTPPAVIDAINGFPLLHAPPPVASLKVTVAPRHTCVAPLMAEGKGLTVTTAVIVQPVWNAGSYALMIFRWS